MGQHGDQVVGRRRLLALVPQVLEIHRAPHQLAPDLLVGHGFALITGGEIRPVGELAPLLEREVEQGGEHLGGEFDAHPVDPVEGLADRKLVEDLGRALTDQRGHRLQTVSRDDRRDHLALGVVLGRVHGDEHRQLEIFRLFVDRDAALRGEHLVMRLYLDDVVKAGDRPVGSGLALRAIVDRGLVAQALEERPEGIVGEALVDADVDLVERRGIGLGPRGVEGGGEIVGHGGIPLCFAVRIRAPCRRSQLNEGQ